MPRATSPPLTLSAVVTAGTAIVASDGFEALTMRRIAEHLGVWPTAVYHYVEDREHLAELVGDAIVGQFTLPTDDVDPVEWLRQLAWGIRAVGLAHPGLAIYLLEHGPAGPSGMHLVEQAAARLAGLGHAGPDLAQVYNWFFTWLAGAVHKTDRFNAKGGPAGLTRFMDRMAAADERDAPHVVAMRPTFTAMPEDPDAVFRWGLERMLATMCSATLPGGEVTRTG